MTALLRVSLFSAALAGTLLAQPAGRVKRTVSEAEVMRVHRSAIVIDTHNDVTSATVAGMDIGKPNTDHSTDLVRMKKGGMGAQFFAVYVAAKYAGGNQAAHRALEMIDTVRHGIVEKYPRDFVLATTAADIRRAHRQHKIAALMGIEGGHAIEDSPRLLRDFYALGIRYMTLTHTNSNHWADSSGDPKQPNNGLAPLGKQIVHEMNRLGMMVDISHVADKTFFDVLEASQAPIFASHSSCRAISPAPRNMTDEMIRALAKKGGVVEINFACDFLNADVLKQGGTKRATLADVVKHIDHVVELAGIDAVGLGSDFDGIECAPIDLDSVDKWPNLTRALLEEGYTAAEIRKIYGGNTLRLMEAVEGVARTMQGAS